MNSLAFSPLIQPIDLEAVWNAQDLGVLNPLPLNCVKKVISRLDAYAANSCKMTSVTLRAFVLMDERKKALRSSKYFNKMFRRELNQLESTEENSNIFMCLSDGLIKQGKNDAAFQIADKIEPKSVREGHIEILKLKQSQPKPENIQPWIPMGMYGFEVQLLNVVIEERYKSELECFGQDVADESVVYFQALKDVEAGEFQKAQDVLESLGDHPPFKVELITKLFKEFIKRGQVDDAAKISDERAAEGDFRFQMDQVVLQMIHNRQIQACSEMIQQADLPAGRADLYAKASIAVFNNYFQPTRSNSQNTEGRRVRFVQI